MKKTLFSILTAFSITANAGGYFGVDVEHVRAKHGTDSIAHYVRGSTVLHDIQLDVQARTASFNNEVGLLNSLEVTAGVPVSFITPFIGVGHDNGFNGTNKYQYLLAGVSTGAQIGPGGVFAGVKTRVTSTQDELTKQTIAYTGYSIPVTKVVSMSINASKSFQDIKEDAVGLGIAFKF